MAQISFRIVGNPKSSGSLKTLIVKGEAMDEGLYKSLPFPADCSARFCYGMKTYPGMTSYSLIVNPVCLAGQNAELTLWVYIPRGYALTKDGAPVSPKDVLDELFGCFCSKFMAITDTDKWRYLTLSDFQNSKPDFVAIVNKYRLEARPEKYVVMGGKGPLSVVIDERKIAEIMTDPGYDEFAAMDRLFLYLQGTPAHLVSLPVPRPRVPGEESQPAVAEPLEAPAASPAPAPVVVGDSTPAPQVAAEVPSPKTADTKNDRKEGGTPDNNRKAMGKKSSAPGILKNRKVWNAAMVVAMLLLGIWFGKMIYGPEKISVYIDDNGVITPGYLIGKSVYKEEFINDSFLGEIGNPDDDALEARIIVKHDATPTPVDTTTVEPPVVIDPEPDPEPTPTAQQIADEGAKWLDKIEKATITFAEVDECEIWATNNNVANITNYIRQVKAVRDFLANLKTGDKDAADIVEEAGKVYAQLDKGDPNMKQYRIIINKFYFTQAQNRTTVPDRVRKHVINKIRGNIDSFQKILSIPLPEDILKL